MLAGEQRGRHHHRDLLAVHHRHEGRPQRHLGLAEADVAADQAVHRPAGGKIVDGRVDRGLLVVGFLIRKPRGEFVIEAVTDGEPRRFAQLALGGDLDQLVGDFLDALLEPRLAGLPAGAAEPVELDVGVLRTVARQQLDVLHRQEQLGALGVVDFQAIVRRAGRLDVLQAGKAADAVIDVHHKVAGREAGRLGDEILRALGGAARPHQTITQDVLLADDRGVGRLETGFQAQHDKRDLRLGQCKGLGPRCNAGKIGEAMVRQHVTHALAGAFAPQRDGDALTGALQRLNVLDHGIEHIGVLLGTLGGKVAAGPRADIDCARTVWHRKGGQPCERQGIEPRFPLLFRQIEPVRRQRVIGRTAVGRRHLLSRLIIIGDLSQSFVGRLFVERLQHDGRSRHVVEQRVELVVKQRQPMLHAGMAAAFAHRLVEQIVAIGGAELRHVAGAELADRLGGELEFGHRDEVEPAQLHRGALRLRIEAADRLQRVAEEVEPHRQVHARRKEVEDAAAHRVVAGLAHRRGADEAVELEPLHDACHAQHVARRRRQRLLGDQVLRGNTLQRRIDGRQQHRRLVAALDAGEPGQRGHALRHDAGVRRDAIVRLAVPGRKLHHLDVGGKERERTPQRRHAWPIAADRKRAQRRRVGPRRDRPRQIGNDQAFHAVRDIGEGERPVGRQQFGRRLRHRPHRSTR